MASSWLFSVVILLWYSTELQIVLAEMGEFSFTDVRYWREESGPPGLKVRETWTDSVYRRIYTEVKPGGASWFITPRLNLPNTSYLDTEAACDRNPCQLEIYGTNQSSAHVFRNYEFIQNLTFETRRINTTIIKKPYPYLYILARTPNTASKTRFYIYSIKIRYYFCDYTTIYNTDVSQIYSSITNISKLVQCPDNALTSDGKSTNTTVQCTPKGNWIFGDLKCVCGKGFFFSNQSCIRCPTDYYKTTIGDERCQKCPDDKTDHAMHTQCKCKKDHYYGDDEDGQCYAVPSEVYNLNIQTVNGTSVNLTWSVPRDDDGFNGSTRYTVECYLCVNESKCDTMVENATFFPAKTNLTTTSVIVSNLMLNEKYKFKVISMNCLKNVPSGKWKFAEKMAAVVWKTAQSNSETKCKCEEKASNSIVMFFAGAGATLVIVLFIVIVILMYKRHVKTSKESSNVHAVGTVEMQVQSPAEPGTRQSQNNQGYVSSIGDETTPYEEVSPPPLYTELNRNRQDVTTADNTYQKLIKHDSGYTLPVHGEQETSYEDVENNKIPSNYQELDSTKRVLDDSASYQKLTNFQRSGPV